MEVILVLLIVAVLNGAVAYIDEMLQELVPMTLYEIGRASCRERV